MSQQSSNWQRKQRVNLQYHGGNHRPIQWHTHQGQGSVEKFHQALFSQVRAVRFNMVDRYNLGTPDNVPESLPPWILQHACFTMNRYLAHTDGMTNYQRR
eukprot:4675712-Amphidinium_carterae.2